jgi:hypothetical protein
MTIGSSGSGRGKTPSESTGSSSETTSVMSVLSEIGVEAHAAVVSTKAATHAEATRPMTTATNQRRTTT